MLDALIAANYPGQDLLELTFVQLESRLKHIPLLEYRRAYPIAALHASILNLMGGRYKAGHAPEQSAKDLEESRKKEQYTPHELLPVYARPVGFIPAEKPQISVRAAKDFLEHDALIPMWVLDVIDIKTISGIAKGG